MLINYHSLLFYIEADSKWPKVEKQQLYQHRFKMIPLIVVIISVGSTFSEWSVCLREAFIAEVFLSLNISLFLPLAFFYCYLRLIFSIPVARSFLSRGDVSPPTSSENVEIWTRSISPSSRSPVSLSLTSSPRTSFSRRHVKGSPMV